MRYQFAPENRAGATTIVFREHRVSFIPGIAELDDAVWLAIKDEPAIADLLETETLRVLTGPAGLVTPPIPPSPDPVTPPKATKKTDAAS